MQEPLCKNYFLLVVVLLDKPLEYSRMHMNLTMDTVLLLAYELPALPE